MIKLMQGNEACSYGALAAGVRFLQVIQLHHLQKSLKQWLNYCLKWAVNSFKWKMKSLVWVLF